MLDTIPPAGERADADAYMLASDGGLIYDPLTREGEKTGAVRKYQDTARTGGTLSLGDARLEFSFPQRVTAYDPVPLHYTLRCPDHRRVLHVSATTFEEEGRRSAAPSFDMNLPGRVDVEYTYLGYIAGTPKEGVRPALQADFSDTTGREFPGLELTELCCSGEVPPALHLWFRFSCRNTGDTILDGEGLGSFMFEPVLERRMEDGKFAPCAVPSNLFYRLFDTLYPGESTELYFRFGPYPGYPMKPGALPTGEYRIVIRGICRSENKQPDFKRIVWSGTPATVSTFSFHVSQQGGMVPPQPVIKQQVQPSDRNGWLHQYEEFQSSFITSVSRGSEEESGSFAVQPAPWNRLLVVRLMEGDGEVVEECCVPIEVESESLKLRLNPAHQGYVRLPDGTREPAVVAQSMADMRGGLALTPYAAENIIGELLDMRRAGINCITTTVAFAMEVGAANPAHTGGARDAFKFMADVLRVLKMPMEGLISYPFGSGATQQLASACLGRPLSAKPGYGDPELVEACRQAAYYGFRRYGDQYWQLGDGRVPLCIEDTRGWIRFDQHNRYPEGEDSLLAFRRWLRERYGTIDSLNTAWGCALASFDEIDPERDGEPGSFGHKYEYRNPQRLFCDYNAAITDWDVFRTAQRREQYRQIVKSIRCEIPQAGICLRTEGANWLVDGISPRSPNPKHRHILFSQRNTAMIASVLNRDGIITAHSDYTTLPYTPTEVAELTGMSIEQGVMVLHMPQFNRMRDVAVNPRYGSDAYTEAYQLASPAKAAYINTVTALFPWLQATYENGGIPGILWQDYLCDGYVTATQFRELCFFRRKMKEMLETLEGREWARDVPPVKEDFRSGSLARWSYSPAYVRAQVERVARGGCDDRLGRSACFSDASAQSV